MTPESRDERVDLMARAMYESPGMICEKCNGVGQDDNIHFWCRTCNGEGWVTDPEFADELREMAGALMDECHANAASALAALEAAGYEVVKRGEASRTHKQRVHLKSRNDRLRTPQPACTFALPSRTFPLTDDPDEVTCHHCRKILREMNA